MTYTAVNLIETKRDGGALTRDQIDWLIPAYLDGTIADEQMSALLMAIYLRGMTPEETVALTEAMVASGTRMTYPGLSRPIVDKHSTGGVGDKITLPLMPLVASYGAAVPQLSGRGLGHTGGTLDKLESIPGWKANLSPQQILHQLEQVGGIVAAAGADLAPADGRLYALRDVTGTVSSIPLIAASIMSKKIAEGTPALVLDVKFGGGAFMRDPALAEDLARTLVRIGNDAGVRTRALLTDMNTPLGLTVGNALEVRESIEVLQGGGPADVVELTVALAAEMLELAGITGVDPAENLRNGKAMDAWRAAVTAQGGDPDGKLPTAKHTHTIHAPHEGYLQHLEALPVGVASWLLGAGRARKEDSVSYGAGIELHAKPGDRLASGQKLMTLHFDDPARLDAALLELVRADVEGGIYGRTMEKTPGPLIAGRISE